MLFLYIFFNVRKYELWIENTYLRVSRRRKKKCEREISTRHALIFVYVHTSSIHTRILKDILLFIFNIGTYFNYIVKYAKRTMNFTIRVCKKEKKKRQKWKKNETDWWIFSMCACVTCLLSLYFSIIVLHLAIQKFTFF